MKCPDCGAGGFVVLKTTVVNHVRESLWPELKSQKYWFCPNSNCDVVYYGDVVIKKSFVKTRVFHKESTPDRPFCYCAGVTEAEVLRHLSTCCKSLEDLKQHTNLGTGKWCPITNPSGRCCLEYITDYITDKRAEVETASEVVFKVEGMHCEGCAHVVKTFLEESGVEVVRIDFRKGLVVTKPAEESVVKRAVEEAGYKYVGRVRG